MKIDLYEKIWMWGVAFVLFAFFASTAVGAWGGAMQPPSHVETIDPKTILTTSEFRKQGVFTDQNGRVHARIVGLTFAWLPSALTVPANTPVTFHVTAMDVVHGFQIVGSNGQTMTIPGYVSRFTTQFREGEYLIVCNEYCGVGHHVMSAKLNVVPRDGWQSPDFQEVDEAPSGGGHGNH